MLQENKLSDFNTTVNNVVDIHKPIGSFIKTAAAMGETHQFHICEQTLKKQGGKKCIKTCQTADFIVRTSYKTVNLSSTKTELFKGYLSFLYVNSPVCVWTYSGSSSCDHPSFKPVFFRQQDSYGHVTMLLPFSKKERKNNCMTSVYKKSSNILLCV